MTNDEKKSAASELWDHLDSARYEGATAEWFRARAYKPLEQIMIMGECLYMMRERPECE